MQALPEVRVDDLVSALRDHRRPAVAVVGAGCSVSAGVPLARVVVDYVRYRYPDAFAQAASAQYPDVMHRLPWQSRYALFHGLVRLSGMNWAHVALAVLMREHVIGRVLAQRRAAAAPPRRLIVL